MCAILDFSTFVFSLSIHCWGAMTSLRSWTQATEFNLSFETSIGKLLENCRAVPVSWCRLGAKSSFKRSEGLQDFVSNSITEWIIEFATWCNILGTSGMIKTCRFSTSRWGAITTVLNLHWFNMRLQTETSFVAPSWETLRTLEFSDRGYLAEFTDGSQRGGDEYSKSAADGFSIKPFSHLFSSHYLSWLPF